MLTDVNDDWMKDDLPDGQYRVFYDNDTSRLQYLFHLKNNNVNGFFLSYYQNGKWACIGTYENDSLWTFRNHSFEHIDSFFKVGHWRYQTKEPYPFEGRSMIEEKTYHIPFQENQLTYVDSWYHTDNSLFSVRYYQKGKGMIREVWFHENGLPASEKAQTPNYFKYR